MLTDEPESGDEGTQPQTPESLADDLRQGLHEPTERPKGKPGWPKGKPRGPRKPAAEGGPGPSQSEPAVSFKVKPEMLTPGIHAIGRSMTTRFHVTEYQETEAADIAKAAAPLLDMLLSQWAINPATAPLVALLIVVLVQAMPRAAEYKIRNAPRNNLLVVPQDPKKEVRLGPD